MAGSGPTSDATGDLAPARERRIGRALVAFGIVGLVTAALLAALTVAVIGPLAIAAAQLEGQREATGAALNSAAGALDAAATSAENVTPSLAQSEAALRDGAAATSQLADAAGGLAAISSAFADTAARSRALSDDLTRTADALARNEADAGAVAGQLDALAREVRSLRSSVTGGPTIPGGPAIIELAAVAFVVLGLVLLGWLATAAAVCTWLGRRLLRRAASSAAGASPG